MKPEDQAQEIELKEWEARQKRAILPEPMQESATHCQDTRCGAPIPERRRKALPGVQHCNECQERIERLQQKRKRTW